MFLLQSKVTMPINTGKPLDQSAIFNTGANSTNVVDRRLLDNIDGTLASAAKAIANRSTGIDYSSIGQFVIY